MTTTIAKPTAGSSRPLPRSMAGLLKRYTPRPLRTDGEHKHVVELVDQLMQVSRPTKDQRDFAGVLAVLVEAYEHDHHGADESELAGVDLLRAVMEETGTSATSIAELLGASRSLVSMILKGERSLTWPHAQALGKRFAMPPAAFMG